MDAVQQALQKIIATYGKDLIADKRRLEGLLRDYCGSQRREIRVLLVAVEDAAEADRTFDMLMGDEVAPRKKFITTHAKYVRNLAV